jgi:hypothetical protein
MPEILFTSRFSRKLQTSDGPTIVSPSGFRKSEAILAIDLVGATPTEVRRPQSVFILLLIDLANSSIKWG